MSFNVGTLLAKLKLDTKGFDAGVAKATKSTGLLSSALKVSLALAAVQATKKLMELGNAGARLQNINKSFDNTGSSGIVKFMGGLSNTEAKVAVLNAQRMNVELTALPHLLQLARKEIVLTGGNLSTTFDSLVKQMGRAKDASQFLADKETGLAAIATDAVGPTAKLDIHWKNIADSMARAATGPANFLQRVVAGALINAGIPAHTVLGTGGGQMLGPLGLPQYQKQWRAGSNLPSDILLRGGKPSKSHGAYGARTAGRGGRPFAGSFGNPGDYENNPGLQGPGSGMEQVDQSLEIGQQLAQGFGASISQAFAVMAQGGNVAKAFGNAMISSIGRVASAMGQFGLASSKLMLSFQTLTPIQGVIASIALLAIGGYLQGLAQPSSAGASTASIGAGYRPGVPAVETAGGNNTLIISGTVVDTGALAKILRDWQRDTGGELMYR